MDRGLFYYLMIPLLALAAILQSTSLTRLAIWGVKPDLVLLLVLIGALLHGPRVALIWAFLGGLFLDTFSGGPMGSSSLALMAAAVVAGPGHRTLSRYHLLVPVGVAVLGTLAYGMVYLGALIALDRVAAMFAIEALRRDISFWATVQTVLGPALLYNTFLMILAIPFMNRVPERPEPLIGLR